MPKLLVIADDLSGATDVGVQFANRGIRSFVTVQPAARRPLPDLFREFEVAIVNIESRHLPPDQARAQVTDLVKEARRVGVEHFYKKTDSTLRGNVGAELDALLKVTGRQVLCFVPAHPALGRTTRDGVQFVHRVPLGESAYASDLRNPVRESRVAAFLEPETKAPIKLIRQNELAVLTKGPVAGMLVFDAETEADLQRTAVMLNLCNCLHVLAGPAAFAACVPNLLTFKKEAPKPLALPPTLLVVNGSLNEVAWRQCAAAEQSGFHFMPLPPAALLSDGPAGEEARGKIVMDVFGLLSAKRPVVLASVKDAAERAAFTAAGQAIRADENSWPDIIARHTGQIVAGILTRSFAAGAPAPEFTTAVIGGDTFVGVARAGEWQGFLPQREILPGVAACEVVERPGLVVISKPGGFGDDDTLVKLQATLTASAGANPSSGEQT